MHELSLAAGALPEFAPEQVAEAAGRAGYSMVGFTIPDSWTSADTRRLQAVIRRWSLTVLDVEVVWIPPGGRLNATHRRIVEAGAELGARHVLTVSSEPDVERTAEALHELCEWAAPYGMRVALEFLMITRIRDLRTALAVANAAAHPAAAVLVDTLHLVRAGDSAEAVAALPRHLLPYAQLCDGYATCEDSHERYLEDALDLRSAPGEGELPLDAILAALPPGCPLSLEIRSKRYRERYPDPLARAAAIRQRTLEFLGTAETR